MPRACPVELHVLSYIAENVSLHGTRPWHPGSVLLAYIAASVKLHGASPWHLLVS